MCIGLEGLRQAFSKFGTIKQATVVVNFGEYKQINSTGTYSHHHLILVTGVSRCYGFVEFESEHACRRAYQVSMNEIMLICYAY
jgi:RNA recognition motif-containing protein